MKTYQCDRCGAHVRYSADIRKVELSAPHLSGTITTSWDICIDCRRHLLFFFDRDPYRELITVGRH